MTSGASLHVCQRRYLAEMCQVPYFSTASLDALEIYGTRPTSCDYLVMPNAHAQPQLKYEFVVTISTSVGPVLVLSSNSIGSLALSAGRIPFRSVER